MVEPPARGGGTVAASAGSGGNGRAWRITAPIIVALIFAVGVYAYRAGARTVRALVDQGNRAAAAITAEMVKREIENSMGLAMALSRSPGLIDAVRRTDADGVRERLRPLVESYPGVERVVVVDTAGNLWSDFPSVADEPGTSPGDSAWFRGAAAESGALLSNGLPRLVQPRPQVVGIAAPVMMPDGTIAAYLCLQYRLESLSEWVEKVRPGSNGRVVVIDREGRPVAYPRDRRDPDTAAGGYAALPEVRAALGGTASDARFRDPLTGEETVATFQPVAIDASRWVVVAAQPVEKAFAPIGALGSGIAFASVGFGVLALLALWRLDRDDVERARAAGKIRESEELNRSILETAQESFVSVNAEGRIIVWNAMAERTFGWTRNEILGKKLVETLIPPRYRDAHRAGFDRFLKTGEGRVLNRRLEFAALHKDGREIPVEMTIAPLRRNDTWIFNAFLHDITERRAADEALRKAHDELEEKIAARTSEVVKINRDLETLIYVITHDLKEPLRAIESFASMVQEQYAGKLDEKGRDFLRRVVRGGGRMRQLLDDLLTLTRVQQGRPAPEYISLTDVTLEALSRLDMKVRERNAIIRLESPLPQVRADRTWVTQAVYNVLDNALKFRQGDAPPEIDIEAFRPERPGDDVAGIVIQDRGPGIPDGLEEKIFQMFQRGVGREVEGTGAGLAIVRQIAERHNGRAFVRARKGGGSEFVITFGLTEEVKS